MSNNYPNTKEGRMAKIRDYLKAFEEMLTSGVFSSSVDGLTVTYRTRQEIERERSRLQVELVMLQRSQSSPMGGVSYEL